MDDAQIERYSRHILLRELGPEGQETLLAACVQVPSLDAAGRACALWLARAGVGTLELPDDRSPAPSLDPAGLLFAEDAGRPLVEAVRERLPFHSPGVGFGTGASLAASFEDASFEDDVDDPVERGAAAALAVLRRLLVASPP